MRHIHLLMLITFVTVTSGCLNGESTQSEGVQAITVEQLTVQPQTILGESSTTAILHVENSGELDAELTIDSDWQDSGLHNNYGDRLLTNRCRDIFDVEDFNARGPGDESADQYEMPPRSEARFTWDLSNQQANIPIQGYSCNLRFQVPFDYSVTAFRQLQFVEDRSITGTPDLESRSSSGPMKINVDTIGSTSELGPSTFVDGDTAEVRIQLENQAQEGTSYTGFIEASIQDIEASGFDFAEEDGECLDRFDQGDELVMYEGESQIIRCRISDEVFDDLDQSTRGGVQVWVDYSYVKDLGSKEVEVEQRG